MFGLTDQELVCIKTVLKENGIKSCVLFGSRAKGNYKKGSDVDIAIVGDQRKLSYCLNELTNLPYFFDVIDLESISNKNLLDHIDRVGKKLL